jgi:CRP-like cAMP-binding protein
MDLLTFLMKSPDLPDRACAARVASYWTPKHVQKGTAIAQQEAQDTHEYIILEGRVASRIYDADGRTVCVGLYVGPCVVTPNIARTRDGTSLVALEAITDVLIAQMESSDLKDLMIESIPLRDWANGVLRDELGRKADREWCLAALGGSDRLAWFRERYPGDEDVFVHTLIASFLGITPVTLSRLRSGDQNT